MKCKIEKNEVHVYYEGSDKFVCRSAASVTDYLTVAIIERLDKIIDLLKSANMLR